MADLALYSSSSPALTQQGSIDWVSLSKSTITFSVDVVHRLSKAGIEPLTISMGQAVCLDLSMKPEAQERLNDALSQLKSFASYSNIVYFGFGVRHILHDLRDSETGSACIALCACLMTSYDSWHAAQVLRELCIACGAPKHLAPSLWQWRTLLNTCAGVLGASSKYPRLVEGFARLLQNRSSDSATTTKVVVPAQPSALANCIRVLLDVASGKAYTAQFIGGAEGNADCAWIGAVAEWLFCLNIEIWADDIASNIGGQSCIYRSFDPSKKEAQVVLLSGTKSRALSGPDSLLWNKTYVLSSSNWFKTSDLAFERRSLWITILQDAFGMPARILFDINFHDNQTLALARLLRGMAFSAEMTSGVSITTEAFYAPSDNITDRNQDSVGSMSVSYVGEMHRGELFLSFASARFPVLKSLLELDVPSQPGYTDLDCFRIFESDVSNKCPCRNCNIHSSMETNTLLCLKKLGLFLVHTLRLLSNVEVDDQVLPSVCGFRKSFQEFEKVFDDLLRPQDRSVGNHANSQPVPLIQAFKLFSQGPGSLEKRDYSALCSNGVCAFYQILEDLDVPYTSVTKIRVVAGRIELKGRNYTYVYDSPQESLTTVRFGPMPEELPLRLLATQDSSTKGFNLGYQVKYEGIWYRIQCKFIHTHLSRAISRTSRMCSHSISNGTLSSVHKTTSDVADDSSKSIKMSHIFINIAENTNLVGERHFFAFEYPWTLLLWWNVDGPSRKQVGYYLPATKYSQLYAKTSLAEHLGCPAEFPAPPWGGEKRTVHTRQCVKCTIEDIECDFQKVAEEKRSAKYEDQYAYGEIFARGEKATWGVVYSMSLPQFSINVELSPAKPWRLTPWRTFSKTL